MNRALKALTLLACSVPVAANAACYIVYDSADRIVYRGENAPVDLSKPTTPQVLAMFPGGFMVITRELEPKLCTPISTQHPVDPSATFAQAAPAR